MEISLSTLRSTCITLVLFASYTKGSYDVESGLQYGGQFLGTCNGDGMYYNNEDSYVMCSHSIAYVMPCAPGTKNSGRQLQTLQAHADVDFAAFCDVNLVDIGYAAFHSQDGGSAKSGKPIGQGSLNQQSYTKSVISYGSSNQGYPSQGNGYPKSNLISYKKKTTFQKAPIYAPGYAQQQQKHVYYSKSYTPPKPKPNPTYGQMFSYGGNNKLIPNRRPVFGYQGHNVQNGIRKF